MKVEGTVQDRTLSAVLGDPAANNTFNVTLDPATRRFNGTWGANKPCAVPARISPRCRSGCRFTGQCAHSGHRDRAFRAS